MMAVVASIFSTASLAEVTRMAKEELLDRLDEPGLVIVDTRREDLWNKQSIKRALHLDTQFTPARDTYAKDATIVFYCA